MVAGDAYEVDHLVIGAGAAGLAFTDALVHESDATVLMVDRRHSPGGHWNDAYPFVRLHQPSAFYGVNSRRLGEDRIDTNGPNAGYYERATAAEICHYFQAVVDEHLLPTGQVELLTKHTCVEQGPDRAVAVSLLNGREREIRVRRKIVDARYLESSIPATHHPNYEVDDDVPFGPVNDLVHLDGSVDGYVVIGAGKTAMDACTWLLDNGVDADEITWIKPREPWVVDRGTFQPREKVGDFIIAWALAAEISARAATVPELFGQLEDAGLLHRIDTSVEPTMYKVAILSDAERKQLRTIEDVVRAGRVRRIQLEHTDAAIDNLARLRVQLGDRLETT